MSKQEIWLQITAGQGPDECALMVGKVAERVRREASSLGLAVEVVEEVPGNHKGTFWSLLLGVYGDNVQPWIRRWEGTIQWICQSPYRPYHKRKNWFIGVKGIEKPEHNLTLINPSDVYFETLKASGPGGQHVNTTNSAIRARHGPSSLSVTVQEERSQHQNKRIALIKLAFLLKEQTEHHKKVIKQGAWSNHLALQRGEAIRTFKGKEFHEQTL